MILGFLRSGRPSFFAILFYAIILILFGSFVHFSRIANKEKIPLEYTRKLAAILRRKEIESLKNAKRDDHFSQLLEDDFYTDVYTLDQTDAALRDFVRLRYMNPPSKLPYNLPGDYPGATFMNSFSLKISSIFKKKREGTFIEAGAYDGVAASNTIYLEKILGWSGLLVECNPYTIPALKMKRRKAWIGEGCLSPTNQMQKVNFSNPSAWAPSAKIGAPANLSQWGIQTDWTQFEVDAIPLYTMLSSIKLTTVDFFSLDVEGAELDVLKTIPFDKVTINVICVEILNLAEEKRIELKEFLQSKGFMLVIDTSYKDDLFFIHSSFKS